MLDVEFISWDGTAVPSLNFAVTESIMVDDSCYYSCVSELLSLGAQILQDKKVGRFLVYWRCPWALVSCTISYQE